MFTFISDGGEFEQLIERHGFPLTRLEPRLTPEKIELVDRRTRTLRGIRHFLLLWSPVAAVSTVYNPAR
jgi:hypothetical protein